MPFQTNWAPLEWRETMAGLNYSCKEWGLPWEKDDHHLPGMDNTLWSLSLPQWPKKSLAEGQCPPSSPSKPIQRRAKAKAADWQIYSQVKSVRGFNPDTDAHTWSSEVLPPSWIKLPGKAMDCKAGLIPAPGCSHTVTHGGCANFSFFLRELKCCKCLCNRGRRMFPAVELG